MSEAVSLDLSNPNADLTGSFGGTSGMPAYSSVTSGFSC